MKKKVFAIVLTICMIFSFMSITASAASVQDTIKDFFNVAVQTADETTVTDNAEEIETPESNDVSDETAKKVTLKMPERFLTLYYGSEYRLHAKASEGTVVYSSSDPSVVTVDDEGNLKAVGRGNAVITARVAGTDVALRCEIAVEFTWQHWIIYLFFFGFLWL